MRPRPLSALAAALLAAGAAQAKVTPEPLRAWVQTGRGDWGACRGFHHPGGLGPPLTPQALADRTIASIVATTLHGRPGTPMPGWKSMLSESDALWIAERLRAGFPDEPKVTK